MADQDWRPSPCLECNELREASAAPVCKNENCSLFGKTVVPLGIELFSPSFKGRVNTRMVQAYKSEDGKTFPNLREAIEYDVTQVFKAMLAEWGGHISPDSKAMAAMALKPQYRGTLIRLMKELD